MLRTALALTLLSSVCAAGCGESKYDVYMKGLEIEGDAERGPCKLTYEQGEHAARLDRGQLVHCLQETDKAIAQYDKAKSMGYEDADFTRVYDRAQARKVRLEQMIEMVGVMERDAIEAQMPGAKGQAEPTR
ncbi:MAG: hypothetical protein AAGA54_33180 [Myxococcota bacterium]